MANVKKISINGLVVVRETWREACAAAGTKVGNLAAYCAHLWMLTKKIQLRGNTIWQGNVVGVHPGKKLRFAHGQAHVQGRTQASMWAMHNLNPGIGEMVKVCGRSVSGTIVYY
ncbi:MAG: hypothetical protein ABSA41_06075 [Terriglobia bacterium]